jgi:hypothetical protein
MRNTMIRLIEIGDPLTFQGSGQTVNAWRSAPVRRDPLLALDVISISEERTHLVVLPELVLFKREPTSPIGPPPSRRGGPFDCKPCGHGWDEHDDDGCLWMVCKCWLPGERK